MASSGQSLGTAVLTLTTDAKGLDKGLNEAREKTRTGMARIQALGNGMTKIGTKLSLAVTAPLVAMGYKMIQAAAEQDEAVAKLAQAVINAGRQGEIAVEDLEAHASKMQGLTRFGDEVQLQAMTVIESLTRVGEAQLTALTDVAMDMATQLDQDLNTTATAIAKYVSGASNEIRGIDIDGTITGPAERATEVVRLLTEQFGGAAEAAAKVGLGPWEQFQNRLGDIGEQYGGILLPRLTTFLEKLDGLLTWFENMNPKAQEFLVTFAGIAAVAGPGLVFLGAIAKAAPAIATAVGALTGVFNGLATALGGLVGAGGGAAMAGLIGGPFGLAIAGFAALSGKAADLAKDIAYWLMDDALPKIKSFVTDAAQWFAQLVLKITGAIDSIVLALGHWVEDRLQNALGKIKTWAEKVGGFFQGLYDKLVGHSIIPDMVGAVLWWMDEMGRGMVAKAEAAVNKVRSLYEKLSEPLGATSPGEFISIVGGKAGSAAKEGGSAALQALGNAAMQLVQWFGALVMSSAAVTQFMDQLTSALAPIIEQIAGPLMAVIGPLAGMLVQLATQIAPVLVEVFGALGAVIAQTAPFWDALSQLIVTVVDAVGGFVVPLLGALVPILTALTPVLQVVSTVFEWLATPLRIVGGTIAWLIEKVVALGTLIWRIVTFQWTKLGDIDWGGSLADAIAAVGATTTTQHGITHEDRFPAKGPQGGGGSSWTTPTWTTPSTTGAGASYQQLRPIHVNIQIIGNTIGGDGSFRALALQIRDELISAGVLGLT